MRAMTGHGRERSGGRRRFYELAAAGLAPIASEALRRIAKLYRFEDRIRGPSAEQRRAVRQGTHAGEDFVQAVQWQVVVELRDRDVSQKASTHHAARYRAASAGNCTIFS